MTDTIYLKLREHLNALPGGYPTTPSGVEIRIIEKLSRRIQELEGALVRKASTTSDLGGN